jgi:predicted membrane-bound mannosyltransferase
MFLALTNLINNILVYIFICFWLLVNNTNKFWDANAGMKWVLVVVGLFYESPKSQNKGVWKTLKSRWKVMVDRSETTHQSFYKSWLTKSNHNESCPPFYQTHAKCCLWCFKLENIVWKCTYELKYMSECEFVPQIMCHLSYCVP